jgi:DNA/RNA-binding domain of Phe-tRNA-synthetase-like protein
VCLTANNQEKVFKQLKSNDAKALQAIQDYYSVLKRYQVDFTEQAPSEVLKRYKDLCLEPIENLPC